MSLVPAPAGLDDSELAAAVRTHVQSGTSRWHVYSNAYTVRVFAQTSASTSWLEVGSGEFGALTFDELKPAVRRQSLSWSSILDPSTANQPTAVDTNNVVFKPFITNWIKNCNGLTHGRQSEVSAAVRAEVVALAAWRCQFEGCGDDLRRHCAPHMRGNYSYFAHIVASSPDGPRGEKTDSVLLADKAENILLLCDKCHRLIDRVAPGRYGRKTLEDMRTQSIAAVERCLNTLKFPLTRTLVLGGSINIEGQLAGFDQKLAQEAMWLSRLRSDIGEPHFFAKNASHLGKSNSPAYWQSLLELVRSFDIATLRAFLAGTSHDQPRGTPIAVFPAHGTSVLVLAGRLLGEARSIHLFQFHRNQLSTRLGGQWAWRGDEPDPHKFVTTILKNALPDSAEALLLVYVTAKCSEHDLPNFLYCENDWVLPTIQVTVSSPSNKAIAHPTDLELLGSALDEAVRILQDDWQAPKVHLIVVAPFTACVRVGQKMQARIHPDFILYEREPAAADAGSRGPFAPTICISRTSVTHVVTGDSCPLV